MNNNIMQSETIVVLKIKDLEVKGATRLLKDCSKFILLNWEGQAMKILDAELVLGGKLHLSWYEPCDKGGLSLFGVNKDGDIICGMSLYLDNLNKKYFEVVSTNKANPYC